MVRFTLLFLLSSLISGAPSSSGFMLPSTKVRTRSDTRLNANKYNDNSRRQVLQKAFSAWFGTTAIAAISSEPLPAFAASFTAGGTLVDREVGVQVGNPEASASRRADNANVIFDKDHYFKFGVGAPWIEPGSTEFPKSVPFTPSQQRYDALKKYGSRVQSGVQYIQGLEEPLARKSSADDFASVIPDPSGTPEYMLRPMGLLANSFLASENTGATNELFLARWYINEVALQLADARSASNKSDALKSYTVAKKAVNSYLGLMNRVITAKVGDKFELLKV